MEPFNIRIKHQKKEITLTILPYNNYFKIIYYGGIVGAIKKVENDWELLEEENIDPGNLPLYDYKNRIEEHAKLTLNLIEVNQITAAIENKLGEITN